MNKQNLEKLKKVLNHVLPQYPVAFAYLYGSQATDKTYAGSDFDIALGIHNIPKSQAFDLILDILPQLAKELKINSEKIDLSNFEQLPLPVRFRVIRDGRLVFCSNLAVHRTQILKDLAQYHDDEPFLEIASQTFLKRMAAS